MPSTLDPVALLERRVRDDGASPLLTCYDLSDGSRVEFSAKTFANWSDKTVNLVTSLGLDEGLDVGLPLLLTRPGHWVGLVWAMAAWQYGGTVLALPRDDLDRVELAVVGPEQPHPVPGVETVACSLHPLGMGLGAPVAGVTDYAEVLSQPDVHWRCPCPEVLADDGARRLRASDELAPSSQRVVVRPDGQPLRLLHDALLAPLAGGGSVVLVLGEADDARLESIATQERAALPLS